MRNCVRLVSIFLVSVSFAIGCNTEEPVKTGTVEGTVKLKGKSFDSGTVGFQNPETGATDAAQVGEGGKFSLASPLPVGTYKVYITPPEAPQPDDEESGKLANQGPEVPDKYQDGSTSGESVEVKEGPNSFEIDFAK